MYSTRLTLPVAALLAVLVLPFLDTRVVAAQEAGPGEGLVIFSRDDKFAGSAIRFNININGAQSLQLLSGSTIRKPMPVGTHTFSVYTPSLDGQDSITIDVKEGWTYHVEGYIRMGWPAGRAKFKFVSESGPEPGAVAAEPPSEALASPALGAVTAQPSAGPTRTTEESGRIGLRNFLGSWDLEMWSLASDGTRREGRGIVEGVTEGDSATRITFTEFSAPDVPAATGGGQVRIAYEDGKGFTLQSWFQHSDEMLRFSGRYEPDTGRYVFFSFGSERETATGIARTSVRVEIRSVDIATWVAETYASVEGQSMVVQSYRFTRR
jgi:hypothetical protein